MEFEVLYCRLLEMPEICKIYIPFHVVNVCKTLCLAWRQISTFNKHNILRENIKASKIVSIKCIFCDYRLNNVAENGKDDYVKVKLLIPFEKC